MCRNQQSVEIAGTCGLDTPFAVLQATRSPVDSKRLDQWISPYWRGPYHINLHPFAKYFLGLKYLFQTILPAQPRRGNSLVITAGDGNMS